MADDNTQIDSGQTDAGQVDGGTDGSQTNGKTTDPTKQSDAEFMSDTLGYIKDATKDEQTDDSTADDGAAADDGSKALADIAGTDIPDAFSDAAEAVGMSPTEIIAFADQYTDAELLDMIPSLAAAAEVGDDADADDAALKTDDKTAQDGDSKDADLKGITPELEAKIADRIAKQLETKFGASLAEIDKFKAFQEEQSTRQMVDTASKAFDEASKDFPVFGKTDELPRFPSGKLAGQIIPTSPAMKARLEVLKYVDAFRNAGVSMGDAMKQALGTYKGLHLEKELERKQVRDLKQHEEKLSGARVGKETKRKYTDTRDEIIDDIRQMQREAGIT